MFNAQTALSEDPVSNIHMLDGTVLYAGSAPFLFSLEFYLQKITIPTTQWYLTVHLISDGSVQRVFTSATIAITPNIVTQVPFPLTTPPPVDTEGYGIQSVAASTTGQLPTAQSIGVKLTDPGAGVPPLLEITDTSLAPTWLIGARNIILTDPPLYSPGTTAPSGSATTGNG